MINADLIAELQAKDPRDVMAWSDLLDRAAAALEAKEREHPSNCNCGYGGFHEPENKNCEANQ
jgi:hypothetical protein